jgi:hypothetical protein
MASKKRNRGKRHKNKKRGYCAGTGKRNRNSRTCTHLNYETEQPCGRRIHVRRGERALCEEYRHRHTLERKTNAIISRNQSCRFNRIWGGAA